MTQPPLDTEADPTAGASSRRGPGGGGGAGRRIFVRGPWEMAASILIGIGVVMLMQPFFLWAFSWSFSVTLLGTVMFIIVSHFPE